jgi:nucleotide-binding universal stress UspA family protein
MVVLKRILVATDFGEAADVALNYGRELARTFGASLEVVHVCDNSTARGRGADGFTVDFSNLQRELEAAAQRQLDALLDEQDRTTLKARAVAVVAATPAEAIVEHAKQARADLILMGTHGRGPVAHFLMGSVAERVVRIAPCPVLTVHHPQREFLRPEAVVAVARA